MSISYFSDINNGGDGRFIRKTSNLIIMPVVAGEVSVAGDYFTDHYHSGVGVIERPVMPISFFVNGSPVAISSELSFSVSDVFRVEGIPSGAVLSFEENEIPINNDGFFKWSSQTTGPARFVLSLFPFLEVVINASVTDT